MDPGQGFMDVIVEMEGAVYLSFRGPMPSHPRQKPLLSGSRRIMSAANVQRGHSTFAQASPLPLHAWIWERSALP